MPRTILIADDDPHIRQLLAVALAKAGFDTIEVEDGEAALAAVESHAPDLVVPDLVVLDINMPRMDGIETCRRLRARVRFRDQGHRADSGEPKAGLRRFAVATIKR